jgi:hypothetical protein
MKQFVAVFASLFVSWNLSQELCWFLLQVCVRVLNAFDKGPSFALLSICYIHPWSNINPPQNYQVRERFDKFYELASRVSTFVQEKI